MGLWQFPPRRTMRRNHTSCTRSRSRSSADALRRFDRSMTLSPMERAATRLFENRYRPPGLAATCTSSYLRRGSPTTENSMIGVQLAQKCLNHAPFKDLDITLMTGAGNPLWQRDSIDRMAEWLRRARTPR